MEFLKKLSLPKFSLKSLTKSPSNIVGVDIGDYSVKVIQLRYDSGRAVLETYGELLTKGYFSAGKDMGRSNYFHHADNEIATVVQDVINESGATSKDAVFSIPVSASFVTTIPFPRLSKQEIEQAIPFEARKYIPIPTSEVVLDWDIFEPDEERESITVLLVAVPVQTIEKIKRIVKIVGLKDRALEIESFSIIRSLLSNSTEVVVLVDIGHQSTTVSVVNNGVLRVSRNISQGGQHITQALERALGVNTDRAEQIKRDVGISDRIEEQEISSVVTPIATNLISEVSRFMEVYNRKSSQKIQKVVLTGGSSNLKGLVDLAASKFQIEVMRGNPFMQVVAPAFMAPTLRELGPGFSTAVGLALHDLTKK